MDTYAQYAESNSLQTRVNIFRVGKKARNSLLFVVLFFFFFLNDGSLSNILEALPLGNSREEQGKQ